VFECLRGAAAAVVRSLQAGTVVICAQTNDPQQFLWIGDRGTESDFKRLPLPRRLVESFEQSIAGSSAPVSLAFLDEFYYFPLSPYWVWGLEVRPPEGEELCVLTDLFELARVARQDRRVAGMSLYRGVEDPGVFVAFLGLAAGFTPGRLLREGSGRPGMVERLERSGEWRPLSVAFEVKRLLTGEQVTRGTGAISPAPFWVRSDGCLSVSATPGEAEEAVVQGG
jgi:hypothetical protein